MFRINSDGSVEGAWLELSAKELNPVIRSCLTGSGEEAPEDLKKWVTWEKGLYESARWLLQKYAIRSYLFAHWKLACLRVRKFHSILLTFILKQEEL